MRTILIATIAASLCAAALGFAFQLRAIPRHEMAEAYQRISTALGGVNRMSRSPRRTHEMRGVVMPSPDLLYSACPFDVSAGPIEIISPQTPGYHSISVYAWNSDNTLTFGGRENRARTGDIHFLFGRGERPEGTDLPFVQAPSERGIILVRRLIGSDLSYESLRALQAGDSCGALADTEELETDR